MRETEGYAAETLQSFRWNLLGFGFSRAWTTGLLAFSANEIWSSGASLLSQVVLFFAATLSALGLAFVSRRLADRIEHHHVIPFVVAFIGMLGMMCVILAKQEYDSLFFYIGLALGGLCSGFYETVWGARFVELPEKSVQICTLLAIGFSSLLGIVIGLMPRLGFYLVMVILLGASVVFYTATLAQAGKSAGSATTTATTATPTKVPRQPLTHSQKALINILIAFFVFSLIYNLIITITYNFIPSEIASQIRFWGNLIAALLLLAASLVGRPISVIGLFRFVLPITAIGFVLYLASPDTMGEIALAISSIGRKFFDILTWVLIVRAVQEHGLSHFRSFGYLIAGKNFGCLLGLVFGSGFLQAQEENLIQLATFVPILILVLIVCFFWLFPERTIDNLFNALPEKAPVVDNDLESKTEALAETCKLTPREKEVLLLAAKGHNLSAIMRSLSISKGTAHAHMTHVYQKLDVHSQQELIELVEQQSL